MLVAIEAGARNRDSESRRGGRDEQGRDGGERKESREGKDHFHIKDHLFETKLYAFPLIYQEKTVLKSAVLVTYKRLHYVFDPLLKICTEDFSLAASLLQIFVLA